MKTVFKITEGCVRQAYDVKTGKCVGQRFVCGDVVNWEDQNGEKADWLEEYEYQPFNMDIN